MAYYGFQKFYNGVVDRPWKTHATLESKDYFLRNGQAVFLGPISPIFWIGLVTVK